MSWLKAYLIATYVRTILTTGDLSVTPIIWYAWGRVLGHFL